VTLKYIRSKKREGDHNEEVNETWEEDKEKAGRKRRDYRLWGKQSIERLA
jgi:hypothetical protein